MQSTSTIFRELPRLLICGATVALLAQACATADEPKPDDPSAKQILDRMARAYADCKTYRDSGIVKTDEGFSRFWRSEVTNCCSAASYFNALHNAMLLVSWERKSAALLRRSRSSTGNFAATSSQFVGTRNCETICLDIGPLREGEGKPRVLWKVDMRREFGVVPTGVMIGSNASHCSIAAYKHLIFVNTTNSRYSANVPAPDAPSLVCFEKNTGKVVWKDNSPGKNILDVQHGSPLVIELNGHGQVIMGQGDGWLRSFDCQTGESIWQFDFNFKSPQRGHPIYLGKRNYFMATPVFHKNRVYVASGRHREHNQDNGRLCCIDATKRGDISSELDDGTGQGKPNPNSGLVWEFVNRGCENASP